MCRLSRFSEYLNFVAPKSGLRGAPVGTPVLAKALLANGERPFFRTSAPLSPNMGCIAQYDATPELVGQLKKGQMLTIQAVNLQGQVINFPLALADFAKANGGPATDPKQYEEQQKKTQEELQKKADELRKKLEQQQGAPSAAAPK